MTAGAVVMYRAKDGAHFGHLIAQGYKWARVEVAGHVRRVPVTDLRPWPPVREAAPVTNVRRGR